MIKKLPMRTCVVSKEKCLKQDLVRIVRTPVGQVLIDLTGKANGRGAYLKTDLKVLEKAKKAKTLDRALETDISESIYEELKTMFED